MYKSVVFAVMLVMAIVVGALIVYGKTGNTGTSVFGQTSGQPSPPKSVTAASSDAGEQIIKKVNLRKLAKTGIISELYRNNTCIAGTSEELFPISAGRSAVFRTVCETGLNKNGSDISARKTLYIILREKGPDGKGYTDEEIITFAHEYKEYKEGVFDYRPKVIDAEASDDGSLLRLLCCFNGEIFMYNLDLNKKTWRDRRLLAGVHSGLYRRVYLEYIPGNVKQVYFLTPDIVFVSFDSGTEYAEKLCFYQEGVGQEYIGDGPEKRLVKSTHGANVIYKGVYWNRVGSKDYLEWKWMTEKGALPDGTPVYGPWRLKDDTHLAETPPVPAQKDWEGWHKLER